MSVLSFRSVLTIRQVRLIERMVDKQSPYGRDFCLTLIEGICYWKQAFLFLYVYFLFQSFRYHIFQKHEATHCLVRFMCSLTSIGFRQEKALFRKLLYTNARRVLQSNDCELWKHSFLSPLFPRESTKGCFGKNSIVDCGYFRHLGDFINTATSVIHQGALRKTTATARTTSLENKHWPN